MEEIKAVVFPKRLLEYGDEPKLLADFEKLDCQNSEARNKLDNNSIDYRCKSSQIPIAGRDQDCDYGKLNLYLDINQVY